MCNAIKFSKSIIVLILFIISPFVFGLDGDQILDNVQPEGGGTVDVQNIKSVISIDDTTEATLETELDHDQITGAGTVDTAEEVQDAMGGMVTDSTEIDFTYDDGVGTITATLKSGVIDETKLDASTNASLDLADSALQSESDPLALKIVGTDNVKDTHIDWGTGAGQVSADDIPDGSTNAIITLTQETNFGTAYSHSQITTGNPHNLDAADVGAQTADDDLTDLADGSLTASKVAGVADADYGDITVSGGVWTVEGGGSMVYPGAGIPLSTGSAWGTSITNNSANWNTAYGWGNHASAGYLTAETDSLAVLKATFTADSQVLVGTGAGTYQAESGATLRTSLGLGTGDSPQFLNATFVNDYVNTTGDYIGFHNQHQKAYGVTDTSDTFYGIQNYVGMIQSGGTIGSLQGLSSEAVIENGAATVIYGANISTMAWGGTASMLSGIGNSVYVDSTVTVSGNVYGIYSGLEINANPGGTVYGIYLAESGYVDYGIYQNGTAPNSLGGSLSTKGLKSIGTNIDHLTLSYDSAGTADWIIKREVNTGSLSIQGTQTGYTNIWLAPSGGNVGVGTSAPLSKFVVSNGGYLGLEIDPTAGSGTSVAIYSYNRSTEAYKPLSYNALEHYMNYGVAMTGGWNRVLSLYSTFPTLVFNSYSSSYAGIGYDYSTSSGLMVFRLGASTIDVFGSGRDVMALRASDGGVWIYGPLEALSYSDHTPYYEGDALSEIMKIRGKDGKIDHSTLPDFAHVQHIRKDDKGKEYIEDGRDLGAMISILTVAVQQLKNENENFKKRMGELEKAMPEFKSADDYSTNLDTNFFTEVVNQ